VFLGIDVGTSAVKTVLIDDAGEILDGAEAALTASRPQPLWSEQNPQDWWTAAGIAVNKLPRSLRGAVRAAGLSGQMHGATLLDKDDRVLRPAMLWNDGRAALQCAELEANVPDIAAITGNRAMPGFTAPKLLWVRQHEPKIFSKTARILLPKDYVRLCMTGDAASDMSDSAGTLWMDVPNRRWSQRMLDATHLCSAQMPRLFEGTEITGSLRADVAQDWGMPQVPIVAGGSDNAAGAVGTGVVYSGDAFLSLGTSGVIFLVSESCEPNAVNGVHTFCHALPDKWHQMAVILSAASCLDWAARICGLAEANSLLNLIEARSQPARTEIFLPYLSGERTPHNDPYAKGMLFGLTHETSASSIGQAVLEGVALACRDGMDALLSGGASIESISVIGGGARSRYWAAILSSVLRRPLVYRDAGPLGPAYGAARLARVGAGNLPWEEVCTPPPVLFVQEPDDRLSDWYAERLLVFRRLYRNCKDLFQET
jgi:xylulokinase